VIWDKQLVPPKVAEVSVLLLSALRNLDAFQHFLYPPVKERKKENITRQDLAAHFAGYNRYGISKLRNASKRTVSVSAWGGLPLYTGSGCAVPKVP
jgi:hypothetical protein